jgi:hypothetical protein
MFDIYSIIPVNNLNIPGQRLLQHPTGMTLLLHNYLSNIRKSMPSSLRLTGGV